MKLSFKTPTDKEFVQICSLIKEFELDDRCLQKSEFTVASYKGELAGFGRLRKHIDCMELCSVGVLKTLRNKGIGKSLINNLLSKTNGPIYVVSIIPNYFREFNFKLSKQYPLSIKDKLNYCTQELVVLEQYVVMVHGID